MPAAYVEHFRAALTHEIAFDGRLVTEEPVDGYPVGQSKPDGRRWAAGSASRHTGENLELHTRNVQAHAHVAEMARPVGPKLRMSYGWARC
ncbi:MAG TPA: hypothetical protein VE270_04225 [Thermoleophilaceae bacterium]|nr:hypothetical protein [Thermoleophilaceae bacterium]